VSWNRFPGAAKADDPRDSNNKRQTTTTTNGRRLLSIKIFPQPEVLRHLYGRRPMLFITLINEFAETIP